MSTPIEDLVNKFGGIDQLTPEEKQTYFKHLEVLHGKQPSIDETKDFVRGLIYQIEKQLVDAKEGTLLSLTLKARLKNALVLEGFLFSAERAKAAMEKYYKEHKEFKSDI